MRNRTGPWSCGHVHGDRSMRHARAIEIDIFQFISGLRRSAFIEPLISLCGVLRASSTNQKSRTGDDRRIEALATRAVQTENIEAKVANFFPSFPFEKNAAALSWHRAEGSQLDSSRALDSRSGRRRIVCEVRITGGRGDCRRVGGERGRAEGVSADVDCN